MMLNVPSVTYHPFGMGSLGDDCTDADGNSVPCDSGGSSSTGSGNTGGPVNDWQAITGCVGPDATGFDCGSCGSGYTLNSGGCVANPTAGATTNPGNYCPANYTYNGAGSCVPNSGGTGTVTIPGQPCPVGYALQGNSCVAPAGGVIPTNASALNPLSSFLNTLASNTPKIVSAITGNPVGGTVNYTPLILLAIGVGVVLMVSGGKR